MSATERRLGLMSAPELPAQIAAELADELPELLSRDRDGRSDVVLAEEPLLAGREGVVEILDAAAASRAEEGWDAALCLTDVPLRDGARPLVAAVDADERIAVVDVPAFGATLVKPRVREAAVSLVAEIAEETIEGSRHLVRPRPTEALTPISRRTAEGERAGIRYVLPAVLGHARLLGGMVRANRPWRAFTGLGAAVVAAFGTGAYALLSSTIWQLSARLSWPRLIAIMLISVTAMVVWLIGAHGVWEGRQVVARRKEAALYNTATVLTIAIAVVCGYLALFVLLYAVGAVLIEGHVFKTNAGATAGPGTYAALAWLGARSAPSPARSARSSRASNASGGQPTATTRAARASPSRAVHPRGVRCDRRPTRILALGRTKEGRAHVGSRSAAAEHAEAGEAAEGGSPRPGEAGPPLRAGGSASWAHLIATGRTGHGSVVCSGWPAQARWR